jgi:phage baseplate assembly protein W
MATRLQALAFPIAVDAALGRLREEHDLDDYVRQLIRQVLLTNPGERINRPDFGAGVRRLLFAPASPASAALAQTMIGQALDTWMGTVIIVDEVKAEADNEKLLVTVVYTVRARGERRFLNLEVTL